MIKIVRVTDAKALNPSQAVYQLVKNDSEVLRFESEKTMPEVLKAAAWAFESQRKELHKKLIEESIK